MLFSYSFFFFFCLSGGDFRYHTDNGGLRLDDFPRRNTVVKLVVINISLVAVLAGSLESSIISRRKAVGMRLGTPLRLDAEQ